MGKYIKVTIVCEEPNIVKCEDFFDIEACGGCKLKDEIINKLRPLGRDILLSCETKDPDFDEKDHFDRCIAEGRG